MESNVDHVEVYPDDDGEFRWRAIGGNGEIVATGESHERPDDAERAARGVLGEDVEVRVLEPEPDPDDAEEGPEPTEGPVEE